MCNGGLELAVTHLNASVGPIVTVEHLSKALRSGSVASLDKTVAAVVTHLFVELDPGLIARCAYEAGSDLRRADELYKESLQSHLPRVLQWENGVAELVGATRPAIRVHGLKNAWKALESIAAVIVADVEQRIGLTMHPSLGETTRVMLAFSHRISNDIDLFIRDPRWIGYLSPRLNSYVESLTSHYDESAVSLKLKLAEGEIDFIVAGSLLGLPEETSPETAFALEPLGEVLAKKLFYRGWLLTARDLFDWWAIETNAAAAIPQKKLATLLETKYEATATALKAMLQSPAAEQAWDAVQAPNKPPFRNAVQWAIGRLVEYRDMTK